MSIRAIPLLVFVFLFYNAIVLAGGSNPDEVLRQVVLPIPMLNGHVWTFSWGDLVILLLLIMLFVELLKATYTS